MLGLSKLHALVPWLGRRNSSRTERPGMPGRNAPCHCGSGKKYKRCCLRSDEARRLETQSAGLNHSHHVASPGGMANRGLRG